ncbi:hypothetical protein [Lactobacillus delbrueckii]|uniref:hypothetical protein n=1 Tax=Lactobacillus delbrueckii TaxID=1584 RepID=UPI001E3EDA04|nr:hypothetical protein [Lactobacillus delbrueckii]MCD5458760.1 hypothetical protein [Lactobacillus delbrueckii subsp. bulgaricus]MCD5471189.1 hypothetical protein [Lactobacillus delbrueckii subsp. bulgaricus]MCD9226353.1 hypothetical protein [Lactobacillus delbrueckii subsp. bulgaricus]UPS59394.1 hypothetical protein M0215_05060 [Lactobacillus delbrueckii subsp. bulgaricus]
MKLEDFLAHVNSGKRIVDPSEELEYCSYLTQEALKVTMERLSWQACQPAW